MKIRIACYNNSMIYGGVWGGNSPFRYLRKDGSMAENMTIASYADGYCKSRREMIQVIKRKYPNARLIGEDTFEVPDD